MSILRNLACFAVLLSSSLCLGDSETIKVGQTFIASSLDPRAGSVPWALVSHGIAEKLFTVDQDGEIVPQIAESVKKIDDDGFVWEVILKMGYKFSDGTSVDASHVVKCLTELNEENSSAKSTLGSMTVTAPDSSNNLLVRIESERSTHVLDAVLAEWVFVIYMIDADGNFIYTGPYVPVHFEEGDHFDLSPNEFYPQADQRPNIELKKYPDGHALADSFKAKEIDLGFHLPIDTLPELREMEGVNVRSFEVGYHYMMFHNTREAHMSDVRVRQAIDLAIDRTALSQALAGGTGTRSLFPDFSPYFMDESDPHGDVSKAEELLDEAGWILVNGKRTKDGEQLTVDLVAYPHRPGLVIMQPVIEKQLTSLGITVRSLLTGDDWSETQTIIDTGDFDLLMWAQHTLPAGDPSWFLNAFFRSDGGNNHAGFESDKVDSLLDELSIKEKHDERVAATATVHDEILSGVPVSNLVTPFWHVGLSERAVDVYVPWGADYYVIRADTFLGMTETSSGYVAKSFVSSSLLLLISAWCML